MASKNLFKNPRVSARTSRSGGSVPRTDTTNEAGGDAYSMTAKHELAQYAMTGTFASGYYSTDDEQLARTVELARQVPPAFLAQLAVYSRTNGKMKDMPAMLAAMLFARRENDLLKLVFGRVIDNGRMLRNFVQIVRSGVTGRNSLGSTGKALVQSYFDSRKPEALFRDSVGNDPSLADVIKLAHPKPTDAARQALYRYIIGKPVEAEQWEALPQLVKDFDTFKAYRLQGSVSDQSPPNVPFEMLTALPLTKDDWKAIAVNGGWQFVRMNLNTFARHGVLEDKEVVKALVKILTNEENIERARVLPYQLLVAYLNVGADIPVVLKNALQTALDISTKNVQTFDVNGVVVGVDLSGSMSAPVTGYRGAATTAAQCSQVASLIAGTVLRRNPETTVIPFATSAFKVNLNPLDSIMTNAQKIHAAGSGGTDCSAPVREAVSRKLKADLFILISDNESWSGAHYARGTGTMNTWPAYKKINPNAKLINIDLAGNGSLQTPKGHKDILNIGGFSDEIFAQINAFVAGKGVTEEGSEKDQWIAAIESVTL